MGWFNKEIAILPRNNDFPFQVQLLYYCNNWVVAQSRSVIPPDQIEFSFRLGSTADICCDEINGKPLNVKFPHLLIKRPGDIIKNAGTSPRDTVSFHYHASTMPLLEALGMLPENSCKEFEFTSNIENLIRSYQLNFYNLYSPGCPEKLDWICFQLIREVLFQAAKPQPGNDEAIIIKNIALWMEQHCCEDISIETLARRCNMSRSAFYRAWQRHIEIAPLQYIMQMRLQTAEKMLLETPYPAAQIAQQANFCSATEFYSKFKARYGTSPAQYRKKHQQGISKPTT